MLADRAGCADYFNTIRPHEVLNMRRPIEVHQQDQQTQLSTNQDLSQDLDEGQTHGR
jgi:hypothetical protein